MCPDPQTVSGRHRSGPHSAGRGSERLHVPGHAFPAAQDAGLPVASGEITVALEDRGQQVLLRYLAGKRPRRTVKTLCASQAYFEAALPLSPRIRSSQSRVAFCQGRAEIFRKNYLSQPRCWSARWPRFRTRVLSPSSITLAGAGGIRRAIPAFRRPKRAPTGTYPMHNTAFAYRNGDYKRHSDVSAHDAACAARALPAVQSRFALPAHEPAARTETQYRKALALDPDAQRHGRPSSGDRPPATV